jgi:hypothetical protein
MCAACRWEEEATMHLTARGGGKPILVKQNGSLIGRPERDRLFDHEILYKSNCLYNVKMLEKMTQQKYNHLEEGHKGWLVPGRGTCKQYTDSAGRPVKKTYQELVVGYSKRRCPQ